MLTVYQTYWSYPQVNFRQHAILLRMKKKNKLSHAESSLLGGKATLTKYGTAHYVEMAKKRWNKKDKK
jgi:hypothetical protein